MFDVENGTKIDRISQMHFHLFVNFYKAVDKTPWGLGPKGIHNHGQKVRFQIMNFLLRILASSFLSCFLSLFLFGPVYTVRARLYLYALAHWSSPYFFNIKFSQSPCIIIIIISYTPVFKDWKKRVTLKQHWQQQLSRTGWKSHELMSESTEWSQRKWTKRRN